MTVFATNALFMVPGQVGGTETYLRRTLSAMAAQLRPDESLAVFANAENADLLEADLAAARREGSSAGVAAVRVVRTGLRAASRARRLVFENAALPAAIAKCGAAALWNPGNAALLRSPCPQVTTVHDMQYRRFPEDFSFAALTAMRLVVPAAVRRSAKVIAVSGFSRDEILRFVPGVPPENVVAVPEAADSAFFAAGGAATCASRGRFLLCVSNSYPHKDLPTAVRAFGSLARRRLDLRLVVLGRPRRGEPALSAEVAALSAEARARVDRIVEPLPFARVLELYRTAAVMLFPSRYEGFGLPVLESMAAGLPVVAARAGSVPEVAGGAASLVEPGDADAFAAAADRLLSDPAAHSSAVAAGRARAAEFSWEAAGAGVLRTLREIASRAPASPRG